eukprot:IDg17303t1
MIKVANVEFAFTMTACSLSPSSNLLEYWEDSHGAVRGTEEDERRSTLRTRSLSISNMPLLSGYLCNSHKVYPALFIFTPSVVRALRQADTVTCERFSMVTPVVAHHVIMRAASLAAAPMRKLCDMRAHHNSTLYRFQHTLHQFPYLYNM